MAGRARWRVIGLLIAGLAVPLIPSAEAGGPGVPRCFGAASRDLLQLCSNPGLRLTVFPSPAVAQTTPSAPCTPVDPKINLCLFGAPAALAVGPIALLGDSHAGHWRAALEGVADAMRWQGLSATLTGCPFSAAPVLSLARRELCRAAIEARLAWLRGQPRISTVFISDHRTPVLRQVGQSSLTAQIAGYIDIWKQLPTTVRHIVVIRDDPSVHSYTAACVQRAIEARHPAGDACAVPRGPALRTDPAVAAARLLHSPRVQVIDLTRFFCDERRCYPVVGGALVYRDAAHLTRVFAATLAPYLLHSLGRLMETWSTS